MKKGQAFDTFKLMIAAVIAVAILGILMGILQQIKLPVGDPESVFQSSMQKCVSNPARIFTTDQIKFEGATNDELSFETYLASTGITQLSAFSCDDFSTQMECTGTTDPIVKFNKRATINAVFHVDCNSGIPEVEITLPPA